MILAARGRPTGRRIARTRCLPRASALGGGGWWFMAKRARKRPVGSVRPTSTNTSGERQGGIVRRQGEPPRTKKDKFAMPHRVRHTISTRGGKIIAWHEQYGIHEISSDDYDDQAPPKFFLEFRRLAEAAFELLRKHGEKSSGEIAKEILSTRPNNPGTAINEALFNWWLDIGRRHGPLSPAQMAARFQMTWRAVKHELERAYPETTGNRPKRAEVDLHTRLWTVYAFSAAWHEWHMEVYGEHVDAFKGRRQKEGLAKGVQKIDARKRKRLDVLLDAIKAWSNLTPGQIVTSEPRRAHINTKLREAGFSEMKAPALKHAIWRARKA